MDVKIYDIDDSGNETYRATCDVRECFPKDDGYNDSEAHAAIAELTDRGRYWCGGGAAPLTLLVRVP